MSSGARRQNRGTGNAAAIMGSQSVSGGMPEAYQSKLKKGDVARPAPEPPKKENVMSSKARKVNPKKTRNVRFTDEGVSLTLDNKPNRLNTDDLKYLTKGMAEIMGRPSGSLAVPSVRQRYIEDFNELPIQRQAIIAKTTAENDYEWVQLIRRWIYSELTRNNRLVVEDSYADLPDNIGGENHTIGKELSIRSLAFTYRDMAKVILQARLMLWRNDIMPDWKNSDDAFTGVTVTEDDVNIPPMLWIMENPVACKWTSATGEAGYHANLTAEDRLIGYFICRTEHLPAGDFLKYMHNNPTVHIFNIVLRDKSDGLWMRYGNDGLKAGDPCHMNASFFLACLRFLKLKIAGQEEKRGNHTQRKQEIKEWGRRAPNLFTEAAPYYVVTLREMEVTEPDPNSPKREWSCHWLVGGKLGFWRKGAVRKDGRVFAPSYCPPHWKGDPTKPEHRTSDPQGIRSIYDVKR